MRRNTVGKLAVMLVVLTVASLAPGAPKNDKDGKDGKQETTWVAQHTYDEVFQAAQDAIERLGDIVTDKDKDKGTISGKQVIGDKITFDIHVEALNAKPETRVTISSTWDVRCWGCNDKLKSRVNSRLQEKLVAEMQKVLATYH